MKLKCVSSEVPWFTEGAIYNAEFRELWSVLDNDSDDWYLTKSDDTDYWLMQGLDDAEFEEVAEDD